MNLYAIVIYLISATTGDLQQEYQSSKPMLLADCHAALIARGPVPVKDGMAQFAVCKRLDETST